MADEKLIAACGTYCGACEMYRAAHDNNTEKINFMLDVFSQYGMKVTAESLECDGCLAGGKITPWCRACAMKNCAEHKDDNGICSPACADFPCEQLKTFSTDKLTHHHEVIENLQRQYAVGLTEHAREEEKRWACPQCGRALAWYDRKCPACGEPRSDQLFTVEYDWTPAKYFEK